MENKTMANLNGFNANQVEPATELEAIPAGKYVAVISASELKQTKSGNGSFLELTFEVIEGEFNGRKVWARLNLDNPNPMAVKIARSELSSLCRAVGVMEPKDSCELHNIPLVITVKQKPDGDGEPRNEIKGFAKKETVIPARPTQAANPTPPWRRG
jgi:hypothetical protein